MTIKLEELGIEELKLLLLSFVNEEFNKDAPKVLDEIIDRTLEIENI